MVFFSVFLDAATMTKVLEIYIALLVAGFCFLHRGVVGFAAAGETMLFSPVL